MNCNCQPKFYKNPDQGNLEFGFNPNSKDYERGYDTGYTWDSNHMPGGPFVFHTSKQDNPKFRKMEADSIRASEEWHAGFKSGLAARMVENRHFARWWKENKGKQYNYS